MEEDHRRDTTRIHVVMLPWLAHGHISPFLELSKRLTKVGDQFFIHFLSTPVNLTSIKNQNKNLHPSIQLIELHLPTLPDLPPLFHTTMNLPPYLMPTLKEAFDLSQPAFTDLLSLLKPDLLIYDFLQPWAPIVAAHLGIPALLFLSTGALTVSYLLHLIKKPMGHGLQFPRFSDWQTQRHRMMLESKAHGLSDSYRFHECIDRSSPFILIKTAEEIEAKYIRYLSELSGKEIVPTGPIISEPMDKAHYECGRFMEWLDKRDRGSIVFVSFGSEYFMSKEEMEEISYGLEISNVGFI
ncbi:Flavanone 7-O-glucoside 2''-O-beta-L-rhamnosyltransferase [Acorus calamus]|uniref:Flavanone 7-O-glucoside 2''-O-beta-L-rhamnosyltransferase n=1 Tax=Acorus calamus TaxID=4465 RepID=A0AAV9EBV0_ACOCL|nr:Flavanone 7-O-glucoside 2''-O-beta-L-rhamnosyltransferase [Acorus calamus]